MTTRTKAVLQSQINTLLADNTSAAITPSDPRSIDTDINDTLHNPQDLIDFDGGVNINDTTDNAKSIDFDAASITTGNTRTITVPDHDVDLGNTLVSDIANGTDGELITWDAAGAPTTVGAGTADQVLTSNGPGAAPTFQATPGALSVSKPADETVTSSTTLQNDDDLVIALSANKYYRFALMFRLGSGSTPDFKMKWAVPAGAAMVWDATGTGFSTETTTKIVSFGGPSDQYIVTEGLLQTAGTAGSFQLTWAQNASDTTVTTIYAGAVLLVWDCT